MYEKVLCLPKIDDNIMGKQLNAKHGVTQGKTSSRNIFSFYISDMSNQLKDMQVSDFTEPNNILQLDDDSLLMSEYERSLILLFKTIFNYAEQKFISINMDKTIYIYICKNPTLHELKFDNRSISAVDPEIGYKWLGFNLCYVLVVIE